MPGDRWFVDETYVKVNGRWTYLYRAVDQYGQGLCCVGRSIGMIEPPPGNQMASASSSKAVSSR